MLNHEIMDENGKILGLSKGVFWRIVGGIVVVCFCGISLYACKRSVNISLDAKRNRVMIQYVTPEK